MNMQSEIRPQGRVDLIEGVSLATRVFRKGTRSVGEPCKLILSLNGVEVSALDETAVGDRAPAQLVIDLRMPEADGRIAIKALSARPWLDGYHPLIIYVAIEGGTKEIGYLVRTPAIDRVLQTIRAELDLPDPDCETFGAA